MFRFAVCFVLLAGSLCFSDSKADLYTKKMVFFDDFRGFDSEFRLIEEMHPDVLLRSWYRWGEPPEDKKYSARSLVVSKLRERGIVLGGGSSLSVVNERDIAQSGFDSSWLAQNIDGTIYNKNGRKYGSISAPGFRVYLIDKMLEQAKAGVKELHFGETNGDLQFDDWTVGLRGNRGFIQWLRQKYSRKPLFCWKSEFGSFGEKMCSGRALTRADFTEFAEMNPDKFRREWGTSGSWHGLNDDKKTAFLSHIYQQNLDSFIYELRTRLNENGYSDVAVDVWGYAEWIRNLKNKPDAIIERIPGKEWGFNWMSDESFDFYRYKERMLKIMNDTIEKMKPVTVVWAVDHPEPFNSFKKLSDKKQAALWGNFSKLCSEANCGVLLRSYVHDQDCCGEKTKELLKNLENKNRKCQ